MNYLDQAPGTTAYTAVLPTIIYVWEIPAVNDTGKSHRGDHKYQYQSSQSGSCWKKSSECWCSHENDKTWCCSSPVSTTYTGFKSQLFW